MTTPEDLIDPISPEAKRTWFGMPARQLKEVIQLARGADPMGGAWPPISDPWGARFRNLKIAISLKLLPAILDEGEDDKSAILKLEDLREFSRGRVGDWQWLRDFCDEWAGVLGIPPKAAGDEHGTGLDKSNEHDVPAAETVRKRGESKQTTIDRWQKDHDDIKKAMKALETTNLTRAANYAKSAGGRSADAMLKGRRSHLKHEAAKGRKGEN